MRRPNPSRFALLPWTESHFAVLAAAAFCLIALPLQAQNFVATGAVDASQFKGNETDPAIAINPRSSSNIFVASVSSATNGLFTAFTTNRTTWTSNIIATAGNTSGLVAAAGEPTVAWDLNSNIFVAYEPSNSMGIAVAVSTNGGKTFFAFTNLVPMHLTDQPRIAVGLAGAATNSVWLVYKDFSLQTPSLVAQSLLTTNIGGISPFSSAEVISGTGSAAFPDIAVGPSNNVMVAYQNNPFSSGASQVFVNVNTNTLLTNGFGPAVTVTSDAIGGLTYIPAEETANGINAGVGVAWDENPISSFYGRAYVVYNAGTAPAINICSRYSTNNGTTWSAEAQVNDDTDTNSHFFPQISVDSTTGSVGYSWLDCRNDTGSSANQILTITNAGVSTNTYTNTFDVDGIPNDDYMAYGTISTNGAASFAPNLPIFTIWNVATLLASNPPPGNFIYSSEASMADNGNGLGRHIALAYASGSLFPIWPDNSGFLPHNPNLPDFDLDVGYSALPTATLGITVTETPNPPTSDEGIDYIIVVTNYGPFTATNVLITNMLATNVTLVGLSNAPGGSVSVVNNGQTVIFSYPILAPATSITNVIIIGASQSGFVTNIASVGSSLPTTIANIEVVTNIVLVNGEDLALTMTVSATNVPVGDPVTFTLTVTNLGPAENGLIYITNTLPGDFAQVTNVVQSQGSYSVSNNTIVFSLGTLNTNQAAATVTYTVTALSPGTNSSLATNSAFVTSTDYDTNLLNNTASAAVNVLGEDLAVSLVASATNANIGATITYTMKITNLGPSSLGIVTFTNTLSDNLGNISILELPAGSGSISGNVISYSMGELAPNQTVTVVYTAQTLSVSATDTNAIGTVTVSSPVYDPNLLNNTASTLTTINGEDLALDMTSSPASALVGQAITYYLNVTNLGPSTTGLITITNLLSTNFGTISVLQSPGTYFIDGDVVVFQLNPLKLNQSTNVVFTAQIIGGGDGVTNVSNTATVSSTDFDQNLLNNTASITTPITGSDLAFGLTSAPASVTVSQTITYSVSVTNVGPSTNGPAIVTSILSPNLSNVVVLQSPGSYTISGSTVTFNLGPLAVNQTTNLTFTASPTSVGTAINSTTVNSLLYTPPQIAATQVLTPPPITNFVVQGFASSAIITWDTPYNAMVQVVYGLTTNYGGFSSVSPSTTHHVVVLTGLARDTNYYFNALTWEQGAMYSTNGSFATVDTIILNTMDAAYSGTWLQGSPLITGVYEGGYFNVANTTTGNWNASATYTPMIPTPGWYNVYVWTPQSTNFSINAQMYVIGATNEIYDSVNQTTNGGAWWQLATNLYLATGLDANVAIYNNTGETNRSVAANAMKWSYIDAQDYSTNDTVPAWWAEYFLGTNTASGAALYADYVLGLTPGNSSSALGFWITNAPSNMVSVCFSPYAGGRNYQLQSTTNLSKPNWVTLTNQPATLTNADPVFTNGSVYGIFTLSRTNAARSFYRLNTQVLQQ